MARNPLDVLRHHVTGAIERGEAAPIEAITADNSQHITLNDNRGRVPSETWLTARGPKATYYAVISYARKHGISPADVGYSVRS